jgi:hypothetical protein
MAITRIKSQDIGDGEVKTIDLLDGNVTTAKIANDAVDKDKLGILSTKGDLITFTTEPVRIGVGTNGQALVADSTQAAGVKWAAAGTLSPANFIDNEVPTGTVNGINDTFTLANVPVAGTVHLFKNGLRQKFGAGNDAIITADSIVFEASNIPESGANLLVDYRVA